MHPRNPQPTRRDLFQIAGTATAAAGVASGQTQGQTHHAHAPAAAAPAAKTAHQRKVFDDQQWRTVQVLCDLILPADERSGSATQAGVPEFIDDWLDFRRHDDGTDAPVVAKRSRGAPEPGASGAAPYTGVNQAVACPRL